MSAPADIIRMQDIQPHHSILIDADTRFALRGKKDIAALLIQLLQLRKTFPWATTAFHMRHICDRSFT